MKTLAKQCGLGAEYVNLIIKNNTYVNIVTAAEAAAAAEAFERGDILISHANAEQGIVDDDIDDDGGGNDVGDLAVDRVDSYPQTPTDHHSPAGGPQLFDFPTGAEPSSLYPQTPPLGPQAVNPYPPQTSLLPPVAVVAPAPPVAATGVKAKPRLNASRQRVRATARILRTLHAINGNGGDDDGGIDGVDDELEGAALARWEAAAVAAGQITAAEISTATDESRPTRHALTMTF
jgi:hypothetical protein